MNADRIKELVACCACREPIAGSPHVNLVALARRPTWDHPTSGNVISGYGPQAVAVVCDACAAAGRKILVAVEWEGEEVRYHPVGELEDLGPEPTCVIERSAAGVPALRCLQCGMLSFHPDDIATLRCKSCGASHQVAVQREGARDG